MRRVGLKPHEFLKFLKFYVLYNDYPNLKNGQRLNRETPIG